MNFKKLLSMIGMLSVVVPASVTVVACGSQTNNDATKESKVQKLLEAGIDGSKLTVTNTQQDALNLMQKAEGIKGVAVLSFVNTADAAKTLEPDNNTLNIKIKVGQVVHTTDKALLTNVTLTDKFLAQAIKRALEEGTDGSTLSVKNTQQDALDILTAQLIDNPNVSLSFVNKGDANLNLIGGDNKLNLNIKVGSATETTKNALFINVNPVNPDKKIADEVQKLLEKGINGSTLGLLNTQEDALKLMQNANGVKGKAVLSFVNKDDASNSLELGPNRLNIKITVGLIVNTTDKALITNIAPTDKELALAIKRTLEEGTDGSTLSVKNTQQDALYILTLQLIDTPNAKLSFVNKADAKEHLKGGENNLNLNIQVGVETVTTTDALITNVNPVNPDDQTAVNEIKTLLENGIDGSKLTDDQTYQDALNLMKTNPTVISSKATLSFVNDDSKKPLKVGSNKLNIKITVETATTTTDKALVKDVQQTADEKTANEIKTLLETTGIDGSTLSDVQTYQDALEIMQKTPEISGKAVLTFTNPTDATNPLVAGNNTLNITIKVGSATVVAKNAKITNVENHDTNIIKAILNASYKIDAADGESADALKTKIDANFIKSPLSNSIKKVFEDSKFQLSDITINSKSLTDQDLTKIGNIHALIIFKYDGKTGSTTLNIAVKNKFTDAQIQTELIKNLKAEPLEATVGTFDKRDDGEKALQKQLQDGIDTYFKGHLSGIYQNEFDSSKLGFYPEVYAQAKSGKYVSEDFFTHPATTTVYFFIGYNEGAKTDTGDYIPIKLTVKSK